MSPAPADRRGLLPADISSPAVLQTKLEAHGYLADEGLATAAYLSLAMGRPLFLEGEAGVGKTSLATALGEMLTAEVIRLQCYEGIDASQALYDWDFPRQLLHLRAVEATGAPNDEAAVARLDSEVYSRRFLISRPLLAALETTPCVLLIDEVDRADDEFEAFLLQVLSDYAVTVPELGTIRAEVPPVAVLTSNRTREVHDALKRRCLYHWVEHPTFEREVAIIRRQVPAASASLARQVAAATAVLRGEDLAKPPGVAESIDWALALVALGAERLDPDTAIATLGAVLKYREDQERARRLDVGALIAAAVGGG